MIVYYTCHKCHLKNRRVEVKDRRILPSGEPEPITDWMKRDVTPAVHRDHLLHYLLCESPVVDLVIAMPPKDMPIGVIGRDFVDRPPSAELFEKKGGD